MAVVQYHSEWSGRPDRLWPQAKLYNLLPPDLIISSLHSSACPSPLLSPLPSPLSPPTERTAIVCARGLWQSREATPSQEVQE